MNIARSHLIISAVLMAVALASASPAADGLEDGSYGVFQYVVRNAEGSIDEISAAIEKASMDSGWSVAGITDSSDPKSCNFMSRVIVLYHPQYADVIVGANTTTGPYAALDRINIFQDEEGTHVSVVNPNSINRTVLMEDTKYREISGKHLQDLRDMILTAVKGTESRVQYGEFRTEGHIGKTMGVVAGGRFEKLVKQKYRMKEGSVEAAGRAIGLEFGKKTKKWGLKLVYEVHIPSRQVYILGVSGSPMDTKSFQIVKGGQDKARKEFSCPGLSHAGAYPIEIVVYMDGKGEIGVATVDAMYRMKMYFEDAGTTAFMKNMKMPGSIDKEITKHIKKGLKK